ncbi:MAG: ATP-binding cassette domain-containing protein [Chromatiaceae bacterium]|jgi:phospholipid/cholesterol/gamma-HCH transport system ATP-binding protein
MTDPQTHIRVEGVALAYGSFLIQQDLTFDIRRGDIFIILGGSGCGKSTVMRSLSGLLEPKVGSVYYNGVNFWETPQAERDRMMHQLGVMYQRGALWSSMTLSENIALPLELHTGLSASQAMSVARYKLALVGLTGFEDFYPSEISGGMQKRVGVARAMALDPEILFFDEPSAGLDPLSARMLDDMILELRESLGTTMVVVTHELASIFAIADDCVFLDAETKTMLTTGNPRELRDHSDIHKVRAFLNRGEL